MLEQGFPRRLGDAHGVILRVEIVDYCPDELDGARFKIFGIGNGNQIVNRGEPADLRLLSNLLRDGPER